MGKPTGFLEIERRDRGYEPVAERVGHYREFVNPLAEPETRSQASRCMDCGIPFCHNGCPVNNQIPDWNDLVYRGEWRVALDNLHSTNNFPEFTGRICPAPCEAACTLNLTDSPVTIKSIECEIVDRGWKEGWITPQVPAAQTGKRVAVIGSGPAGLACAQQLARAGHAVTLLEKNDRIGGLLRYGIPDFKMEKHHIDRRIEQMRAEGVTFRPGIEVGVTVSVESLVAEFDAVVMSGGAEEARALDLPAHNFSGIHFAMEFLPQQNRRNAGDDESKAAPAGTISAKGKHVVVVGGGDTGSDCVGTSIRQGAVSVTQLEIMPRAPDREDKLHVWPDYPSPAQLFRTSSSQAEGVHRDFAITTKYAIGEDGRLTGLKCARVEWVAGYDGRMQMREIEGSEFELKADLVLLAMGFVGPRRQGLVEQSGVDLDPRGNVKATVVDYKTSREKVFSCGDMRRGQSLVVWAIREGRQCARSVDAYLMGSSTLPR